VVDGTRTQHSRDTSGTNLNSFNSFSILDDEDICSRALEMGVDPNTFTLENINHIKDLEIARHNLNCKSQVLQNEQKDIQTGEPNQVLFLGFGEENEEEEEFTPVVSRRTRKKLKSAKKSKDLWKTIDARQGLWGHSLVLVLPRGKSLIVTLCVA
jgi:hypothetical protein